MTERTPPLRPSTYGDEGGFPASSGPRVDVYRPEEPGRLPTDAGYRAGEPVAVPILGEPVPVPIHGELGRDPSTVGRRPGELHRAPTDASYRPGDAGRVPTGYRPEEPGYTVRDDGDDGISRPLPSRPAPSHYAPSIRPPRSPVATPFRDIGYQDAERERLERLDEVEHRLHNVADTAQEAEDGREAEFRRAEDERRRIFMENEGRREEQATETRNALLENLERLGAPQPPMEPPVGDHESYHAGDRDSFHAGDRDSIAPSVRTALHEAASRHASDILDTVRMEREESAREREAAAMERDRLLSEAETERRNVAEQRENRIRDLEDELQRVRAELDNERQQRITEESDARERERLEFAERDEAMRNQLGDITNLVNDQREMCETKKILMEERWGDKQNRRTEKDYRWIELRDMVNRIHDGLESDRAKAEEARILAESKPGQSIPFLLLERC